MKYEIYRLSYSFQPVGHDVAPPTFPGAAAPSITVANSPEQIHSLMAEFAQIDAAAARIMKSGISTDNAKYAEMLAAETAAARVETTQDASSDHSPPPVNGSAPKEAPSDVTRPEVQQFEPLHGPIPTTKDEARLIQLLQNSPVAALDQTDKGRAAFADICAEIEELNRRIAKADKKRAAAAVIAH